MASCSGASSDATVAEPTSTSSPDAPTSDPAEFLRAVMARLEPLERLDVALALAYIARRFGHVEDLRWAEETSMATADEVLDSDELVALRPFVRFIRPVEQPSRIVGDVIEPSGEVNTDAMVMRALWCDVIALPPDYLSDVATAADRGGYELTHAMASSQLLVENGCDVADAERLRDGLAPRVAELLAPTEASDLELESCGLLFWVGHGDRVPADYQSIVRRSQLPDGGWPEKVGDDVSDPHATAWGLRCEMELLGGAGLAPTRWAVD